MRAAESSLSPPSQQLERPPTGVQRIGLDGAVLGRSGGNRHNGSKMSEVIPEPWLWSTKRGCNTQKSIRGSGLRLFRLVRSKTPQMAHSLAHSLLQLLWAFQLIRERSWQMPAGRKQIKCGCGRLKGKTQSGRPVAGIGQHIRRDGAYSLCLTSTLDLLAFAEPFYWPRPGLNLEMPLQQHSLAVPCTMLQRALRLVADQAPHRTTEQKHCRRLLGHVAQGMEILLSRPALPKACSPYSYSCAGSSVGFRPECHVRAPDLPLIPAAPSSRSTGPR